MIAWINRHRSTMKQDLRTQVPFVLMIGALCAVAYYLYPHPRLAMWFGFGIAGYSAIANDSIQTLGTFLSSNKKVRWWVLWLFIGGILVATYASGWLTSGGDISFERLSEIPQPSTYTFLTLSAPIILLILTKLRMPVSTTFLLLSTFSSTAIVQKMLTKTLIGYAVAFLVAIFVWAVVASLMKRGLAPKKYNRKLWRWLQAASTSFLWWTWIMHDTANVAVFLPRALSLNQMLIAVGYLFAVVGLLMYMKGGSIQVIVNEKTDITDTRSATIIDFVYALVLLVFKNWNMIPMSTTWVFLGLLAGREIALTLLSKREEPYKTTARLVLKDIFRASMGLAISLMIVVYLM